MMSRSTVVPLRQPDQGDGALTALLRSGARRLLAQAVEAEAEAFLARLRDEWEADYTGWQRRDLSAGRHVCIWADGACLQARMEPQAGCPTTKASRDARRRRRRGVPDDEGVAGCPTTKASRVPDDEGVAGCPATGEGAPGFWKALDAVSPSTRHQRCTVHKTATVLDRMPRSMQPAARSDLREIWTAPGRATADRATADRATAKAAVATFAERYEAKHDKAVTCLITHHPGSGVAPRLLSRRLGGGHP